MKKILTTLGLAALFCAGAQAQSAIRQLEIMSGTTIPRYHGSANMRVEAGSGFDSSVEYSNSYGVGWVMELENSVRSYPEARAKAWEARKAAREEAIDEIRYSRTSHFKLKDVKPVDPMAGKTLPANLGATGNLAVYAQYDKNGNPTYGIWNKDKGKWAYKPKYSALKIVGPHAAAATLKGKVGIIDPATGKPVMDFTFDKYKAFHYPESALNTMIAVGKTSPEGKESWYVMQADADGNYIQSGPEMSSVSCIEDGTGYKALYRTAESKKVGMLDEHGREVLPPVFDGLKYLEFTADDASCYQARLTGSDGQNHFGVVDEKGRSVVPCVYDRIDVPDHGKYGIQVYQGGKTGWYGTDGKEILPAGFDSLAMDHFWDGDKHRAFFRGSFIDDNGTAWFALYDTQGRQLTDFSARQPTDDAIRHLASQLEEYRIY